MGLFGKNNHNTKEFNQDLVQNIAILMNKVKITKQPVLKFLYDDVGICSYYTQIVLDDPGMKKFAKQDFTTYLNILACHAFGAGVVTTLAQDKYKKPVQEFQEKEVREILLSLQQTDAYELALNMLRIPTDSANKNVLDNIVTFSTNAALKSYSRELHEDEYLKELIQVFFNAGVTMVMRD